MSIGGILLSMVAYMIIGTFWYSGAFLGKVWQKLVKLDFDKMDREKMTAAFVSSAAAAFVMASVLNYLMVEFEVSTTVQALSLGGMLWLGFSGTSIFVNNMYQQKPLLLTLVDGGYQLAGILTMSSILYYLI